jgi:hypothetical protein
MIWNAIETSPTSSLELYSSQTAKAYITDQELDMAGSSDVVEGATLISLTDHVYPRDVIKKQDPESDMGGNGEEWEIEIVTENLEDDDYRTGDESNDNVEIFFISDDEGSSEDDDSDDIEIFFVPDRDSGDDNDFSAGDIIYATDVSSDYSIGKRKRLFTRWPEIGWWDNPEKCLAKPEDKKEECKGTEKMHIIAIAAGRYVHYLSLNILNAIPTLPALPVYVVSF